MLKLCERSLCEVEICTSNAHAQLGLLGIELLGSAFPESLRQSHRGSMLSPNPVVATCFQSFGVNPKLEILNPMPSFRPACNQS